MPQAEEATTELALRAQIIHRVLLFVRWPADRLATGSPLELCLVDDSPQAMALQSLAGQEVNGHTLQVRKSATDQIGRCHVVYVSGQAARVLAVTPRRGVLTVGDQFGLIDEGVMLNLQSGKEKLVFDIGLASARAQDLDIATKLLRLARYVKDH